MQEIAQGSAQAVQLPDNERVAGSETVQSLVQLRAVPASGFAARLVFLVNSCATLSLNCADLSRGILFISANSSITNLHTKYIGAATGE